MTLLDENMESIDYERVSRTDTVGVTGMSVQRRRMWKILSELKARDPLAVVGGPWISLSFGHRPRLKTGPQIIDELEALKAQGVDAAFIVDDNLIGNKKAIKGLLGELIVDQHANGYPFYFFTEASLDLAEDERLMRLMVDTNIVSVFIGIESLNEQSLTETRKFQNVRLPGTLAERIRRIQKASMEGWCGIILGFDHDDRRICAAQRRFLQDARIVTAIIGMLYAIPKTLLYARLAHEGRLDPADEPSRAPSPARWQGC